ncbi:hypothetical protein BofuT4_uP148770.1 [Botrytis cinerea T4]|uniref:Uncharacterized protein n=1 Tax=Botryotinia fuckeliana (strain T4) TaxID=999810 RepID=G2YX29_BOTF4|nr:hypothetical protein BofuT4_uP148770.1 [Botrytis cinerea T4]
MFWDPLAIKNVLGNNMSTQSWFKTDEPAPNSKIDYRLPTTDYWLLATGYWLLATGY